MSCCVEAVLVLVDCTVELVDNSASAVSSLTLDEAAVSVDSDFFCSNAYSVEIFASEVTSVERAFELCVDSVKSSRAFKSDFASVFASSDSVLGQLHFVLMHCR